MIEAGPRGSLGSGAHGGVDVIIVFLLELLARAVIDGAPPAATQVACPRLLLRETGRLSARLRHRGYGGYRGDGADRPT